MKVSDPGYVYELEDGMHLIFMKKENSELVHIGTTNEEVIEVLINRLEYLQIKLPCEENGWAVSKLKDALDWLRRRTKKRVEQGIEGNTELNHK
uniref:Putative structural protein n=1 Tax=viral metagenome TaxID=1070528 RepID=A0A6M3ISA9_9ZZZZ